MTTPVRPLPGPPLDPPGPLIERIRRDAEAAELALHRGALRREHFEQQCAALVRTAIAVVQEHCAARGTSPAQVLAGEFRDNSALLERRLAVTRARLARLYHALMLQRAQQVLASPDSTLVPTSDLDGTELPEVLIDGAWRTVIDVDVDASWRLHLVTADGGRIALAALETGRVWTRARRRAPCAPPEAPVRANAAGR